MNKILLELFLPASGKTLDVKIPRQLSVYQATQMIICMLEEMNIGEYMPDIDAILCDAMTGKAYDVNASIDSLELCTGTRIMLV